MIGPYIVICRTDREPRSRRKPPYVIATRQTFATREAAEAYARPIAKSREPIIVEGRFAELREVQS